MPSTFSNLPEIVKRKNIWLTRNCHGIEWFDGHVNLIYFTIHLQDITRHARYIYRGQEKARYLNNILSRNVYNLEEISPAFKKSTRFRKLWTTLHADFESTSNHIAPYTTLILGVQKSSEL